MDRTSHKVAFFTILYFVQGAAFAFAGIFQKPYLAERGIEMRALGAFTALLLLPFVLKIFLGLMSDRLPIGSYGSRKPYMIIGLAIFSGCYFVLSALAPEQNFSLYVAITFAASVGLALFDTCCDGWAIDVARIEEQSAVQASMVAGRSAGFFAGALVFGVAAEQLGYPAVFYTLSILAGMVALVVVASPYRPLGGGQLQPTRSLPWWEFRDWLTPRYLVFALYATLYSIASFGTDGILTLYLADTRLSGPLEIGMFGVFRGIGALLGAIAFVRSERLHPMRSVTTGALVLLGVGCVIPLLGLPVSVTGSLWGLVHGLQETAFVTLAMRLSRGAWAATFFAVCMIFSNVGTAVGEVIAAPVADRFGYIVVFLGFALLAWLGALSMPRLLERYKVF